MASPIETNVPYQSLLCDEKYGLPVHTKNRFAQIDGQERLPKQYDFQIKDAPPHRNLERIRKRHFQKQEYHAYSTLYNGGQCKALFEPLGNGCKFLVASLKCNL